MNTQTIEVKYLGGHTYGDAEKEKKPILLKGEKVAWKCPLHMVDEGQKGGGGFIDVYEVDGEDGEELVLYFRHLFPREKVFTDKEVSKWLNSLPEEERIMREPGINSLDLKASADIIRVNYSEKRTKHVKKPFVYVDAWGRVFNNNSGYILVRGLRGYIRQKSGARLFDPSGTEFNMRAKLTEELYEGMREISLSDRRYMPLSLHYSDDLDSSHFHTAMEDIAQHYCLETKGSGAQKMKKAQIDSFNRRQRERYEKYCEGESWKIMDIVDEFGVQQSDGGRALKVKNPHYKKDAWFGWHKVKFELEETGGAYPWYKDEKALEIHPVFLEESGVLEEGDKGYEAAKARMEEAQKREEDEARKEERQQRARLTARKRQLVKELAEVESELGEQGKNDKGTRQQQMELL